LYAKGTRATLASPVPSATQTDRIIATTEAVSARNYAPLPVVIERGQGVWVWDVEGKRYLDCISAYSALNHGHCHPRIMAALNEQAERLTLTSRAVHNDRMGAVLKTLCEISGMDVALPMYTGVEAVETAIKLARKWGYRRKKVAANRAEVVVCRNNFHGRTTTVVGFSSDPQYREDFGPYGPGFPMIDFGDAEQLAASITPATVAFLTEPIQAEGGVVMPPHGFLHAARRICKAHNVLFMLDEIQTGLGRTGRLFAHQHEADAAPDVLIVGKALGGGAYPVSAVLARRGIMDVFEPGDHGSTFGGNPLGAAVAEAALAVMLDEKLSERAARLGEKLLRALAALKSPHIVAVRGRGLLIGIETAPQSGPARALALRLLEHGVLAKDTRSQVLRLAPPLVIDDAEIDWLVERLAAALG
jgi:ornithine--oxo-acid transaminase